MKAESSLSESPSKSFYLDSTSTVTDKESFMRLASLEKDLKIKDEQVEQLLNERKTLERIASKQEEV
jgi:hypothetical protein